MIICPIKWVKYLIIFYNSLQNVLYFVVMAVFPVKKKKSFILDVTLLTIMFVIGVNKSSKVLYINYIKF